MAKVVQQDPGWQPLLVEFWTHASRQESLRLEVIKRHERTLDALTALLDEVAAATASSTGSPTWSRPQHLRPPLLWTDCGCDGVVPSPVEFRPVAWIERDGGQGAKLKLVAVSG